MQGRVHEAAGRAAAAMEAYNTALALDPRHAPSLLSLGVSRGRVWRRMSQRWRRSVQPRIRTSDPFKVFKPVLPGIPPRTALKDTLYRPHGIHLCTALPLQARCTGGMAPSLTWHWQGTCCPTLCGTFGQAEQMRVLGIG